MLTNLSKIISNFRVDFEINFGADFRIDFEIDFKIDFGLFILYFLEFRFYKFLIQKKENRAIYTQIRTVFFKLIDQKYGFFNFAFYLMIQKVEHRILL